MKKKLVALALVGALVFGLVACSDSEDNAKAISGKQIDFTWSDSEARKGLAAEIAAGKKVTKNNSEVDPTLDDMLYRSFVTLKTKHDSSDAIVTIYNVTDLADTDADISAKAGLGYVFGLKEEKHDDAVKIQTTTNKQETVKFYTFGVASVRWSKKANDGNGGFQWYVSWCDDVPNTCFNYTSSTAFSDKLTGTEGNAEITKKSFGEETKVIPTESETTTFWRDVEGIGLIDAEGDGEKNDIQVKLVITANEDGSYKVQLQKWGDNGQWTDAGSDENTHWGTVEDKATGLDAKTQLDIGRYLTVYNKQSVTGQIVLENISRMAVTEFDEEDLAIKGYALQ